ncbi:hypothetical protein ABVK25_011820 [Lepraria finkii]|uniref:Uncharacterized protein n=1 Tax=Lepraria finkii TaxID=1340010 RepID=A0ABR4AMP8_9LECA
MLNFDKVYNIPALTFPTPSIWPTTSPLLIYKRDAACTPTSTNVPSITPAPVVTTASPIAPPTSVPAVTTPSAPPLIVKAWMNPDAGFAECPVIRASTSNAAAAAYAATQTTPLPQNPPPSSSLSVVWKSECLYDPGENCVLITHPLSNSGSITLGPEPSALLPGVILPAPCLDNGSNCDPNGIFITAQDAAATTGVVEMIPEPMPAGADGVAGNVD